MTVADTVHYHESFDAQSVIPGAWNGHKFFFCTFTHSQWTEKTAPYGMVWYGCTAHYLEAPGVHFDHFTAVDCDFSHANFQGSRWTRSRASKCDFTWTSFRDADVHDLTGSRNVWAISRLQQAAAINPYDREQVAELLRCESNGDVEILMVAALVQSSMDFCWSECRAYCALPQWQRVGAIISRILCKYPWFSRTLDNHTSEDACPHPQLSSPSSPVSPLAGLRPPAVS